jgi:hypothetical protein
MNVIVSQLLGNAYTVSEQGILYLTPLLENDEYNNETWVKAQTVNESYVAEIECVVMNIVDNSDTETINNILHSQLEVVTA